MNNQTENQTNFGYRTMWILYKWKYLFLLTGNLNWSNPKCRVPWSLPYYILCLIDHCLSYNYAFVFMIYCIKNIIILYLYLVRNYLIWPWFLGIINYKWILHPYKSIFHIGITLILIMFVFIWQLFTLLLIFTS